MLKFGSAKSLSKDPFWPLDPFVTLFPFFLHKDFYIFPLDDRFKRLPGFNFHIILYLILFCARSERAIFLRSNRSKYPFSMIFNTENNMQRTAMQSSN